MTDETEVKKGDHVVYDYSGIQIYGIIQGIFKKRQGGTFVAMRVIGENPNTRVFSIKHIRACACK